MTEDEFYKAIGMDRRNADRKSGTMDADAAGRAILQFARTFIMMSAPLDDSSKPANFEQMRAEILDKIRNNEAQHGGDLYSYDVDVKLLLIFTIKVVASVCSQTAQALTLDLLLNNGEK